MLFLAQKGTRRAERIVCVAQIVVRCRLQHNVVLCADHRVKDGELRPLLIGSDGVHANPELPVNVGRQHIAIYHTAHENVSRL